ncbi:hypothetical protein [Streptomyces hyaluromycini]|uniref:hypothetical protein n=1 Tax=Streptomyces hyaluromycini TaxID=1377993 RepID=UPI001237C3EC|nr:hypothetical protein [Streptomyces hyaluromycini]
MSALTQNVHAAGDTSLNKSSVLIAGEREALLVDGQFTLAEQHRALGEIIDSGKELTTVVVTAGDSDYCPKEALFERCPDLGLLVFLDPGTRVAIGVMARG